MADDPLDPICAALVDVVRDVTPARARTMAEGTAATWKLSPMELRLLVDELIGDGTDLRLSPVGILTTMTTMLALATRPRGRELLQLAVEAGERFARGERARPQRGGRYFPSASMRGRAARRIARGDPQNSREINP